MNLSGVIMWWLFGRDEQLGGQILKLRMGFGRCWPSPTFHQCLAPGLIPDVDGLSHSTFRIIHRNLKMDWVHGGVDEDELCKAPVMRERFAQGLWQI